MHDFMKPFWALILVFFSLSSAFANHTVTFIVPCYNSEKWVKEAVESIYDQKLSCPFEVICIDDGSTDSTYEALLSLTYYRPHLQIIQNSSRQGIGAACNTCVKNSSGDLIFRLDPQNILAKNSVSKLIDLIDQSAFEAVCFGELKYFTDPFVETGSLRYHTKRKFYRLKDIFRSSDTPCWSGNYLYTRHSYDVVGGYPTEWDGLDAFAFGFQQLEKEFTIGYAEDSYYWHRREIDKANITERDHLNLSFFKFLLEYESFFTITSVWLMEKEIRNFENHGRVSQDVNWYLTNQKLRLR